MLSAKAQKEIESLTVKIGSFHLEKKQINASMDKIDDKIWKTEEKIRTIQKEEISTSERSVLAREAWDHFTTTFSEESLGKTSITKIGFSKVLNAYVEVDLTKYSSFMSNVKGCGSLANKKELHSWTIITKERFDEIIAI